MVTNCVKACLVSGAIASTMVPGSPLITSGDGTSLRKQNNREVSPDISPLPTVKVATEKADVKAKRRPASRRALGRFRMTAYTRYRRSSGRTASGTRPSHERTVAVDPRVIPLGTKIEIEGVGVRIAEDTGRLIKGRKLDVFLPSVQACTRFGVRSRKVYIID
jgi:3D (Asp-Asp-Asp) domain-containing protein